MKNYEPELVAFTHSRKAFYYGRDIYWYQLICHPSYVPIGFLNIPDTELYEYCGTHIDALKALIQAGFRIEEGTEL